MCVGRGPILEPRWFRLNDSHLVCHAPRPARFGNPATFSDCSEASIGQSEETPRTVRRPAPRVVNRVVGLAAGTRFELELWEAGSGRDRPRAMLGHDDRLSMQ